MVMRRGVEIGQGGIASLAQSGGLRVCLQRVMSLARRHA